jgi:branched-chain amino acid aminotransferase
MNERFAYHNGAIVPESQAKVSFNDYGFAVGDGVFDSTRTVGHKPFLLEAHVERLFRSLGYVRIDPGLSRQDMLEASLAVLERNLPLLSEHDDYWLTQWVTRGLRGSGRMRASGPPTVIIECSPLPFRERALAMRDGLEVVIPPGIRRTPPEAMSPRVKTMSYANLAAGDAEVQDLAPGATSVLLDTRGCLAEGLGSNIFIVANGELLTPQARYVLAGLSRQTVMEVAIERGIPVREADIDLYDAYTADEAFITSTSWCMVPVRSINGRRIGAGNLPRPVTAALIEGYKARLGGFDFVGQYLRFADASKPAA